MKHFAPPGLFGVSVKTLKLELNAHETLSGTFSPQVLYRTSSLIGIIGENMLQCINNFEALEDLTLSIWFGMSVLDKSLLHDVLSHVQPSRFASLTLDLGPSIGSYGMSRAELLEFVAGGAVVHTLGTFRKLADLRVTLTDEDPRFDESWWASRLRDLLPELKADVCVDVDVDSTCLCTLVMATCSLLWAYVADFIGLWSKDVQSTAGECECTDER